MNNLTRIFSWGYYEHVVSGLLLKFGESPDLRFRMFDMCRDFDSFFIEDLYPFEETEKILVERLEAVARQFKKR